MNDLLVRRSVDEALRLIQGFQFTVSDLSYFIYVDGADVGRMKDEHGEVCPVNWVEGGKTIRGDPIAKLDYFAPVDGEHENGEVNHTSARVSSRRRAKSQHVRGVWGVVWPGASTRWRT